MLDEISHAKPPSRYLEEASDAKKVAQQLGTLGGGNHFLGKCLCAIHHATKCGMRVVCSDLLESLEA